MPLEGERIDAGGPLTFRYEIDKLQTPEDGRSTIVVTFDGDTEYFMNCQSVPDGRCGARRRLRPGNRDAAAQGLWLATGRRYSARSMPKLSSK